MSFRDIVGHRQLVSLLARSIANERLPPSLLFDGPAGIGKRLTALAVAQASNCLASPRPRFEPDAGKGAGRGVVAGPGTESRYEDACGTCAACTRIQRGVHPDVLVVQPGDNGSIKIDPIRDLIERVAYRPFEGRRRVVIVDGADAIVPAGQNALLKTLEEPPPASMFILITPQPDLLLPTVRSRCPRLRFQPLAPDEVAQVLMKQGKSETEARAVAATVEGSVGRALETSGADLVETRDVALRVLVQAAASNDPRRRIDLAKDLVAKTGGGGAADRDQLAVQLRAMASLLRDVELLAAGGDRAMLANGDVASSLSRLNAYEGPRGVAAFQAIDRGLAALERNASAKIVADWVAIEL